MLDNRNLFAWYFNKWNFSDVIENIFKRKWCEFDEEQQRKIARCLSDCDRRIIEMILDELGV